jgi:hypothetical protein
MMKFILGMPIYYGIGIACWVLAMHIENKYELHLFLEYETWIILAWPLLAPVEVFAGLLYLLRRVRKLFKNKKPPKDKRREEPEKLEVDWLYNYLLSEGVNRRDAADIVEELEGYNPRRTLGWL